MTAAAYPRGTYRFVDREYLNITDLTLAGVEPVHDYLEAAR